MKQLVQPEQQRVQHVRRPHEPGRVEVEAQRRAVLFIMSEVYTSHVTMIWKDYLSTLPDEVVGEHVVQGVGGPDLRAAVQHGAPGHKLLHTARLLPRVQLVHHHLHEGVAPGGALLVVTIAPVGRGEGEWVGPVGRVSQGRHHRAVIQEVCLLQSRHLPVAAHLEEGGATPVELGLGDVGPQAEDLLHPSHLLGPGLVRATLPVILVILVSDGVGCNLVTSSVQFLKQSIS